MNKIFNHIRTNIGRGILTMIPLALCFFAALFLYAFIDHKVMVFLGQYFDVYNIPGFGLLLLVLFFYVLGIIASNVIGRGIFKLIEKITVRIPLVKHVYSVSKSIGDAMANNPQGIFKKVVLINYPTPNQWTVALTTGQVKDEGTGENLLKVFVPMAHPVIGFVFLVRESQVKDTGWPIEGTMKMLISVGIIDPRTIPRPV